MELYAGDEAGAAEALNRLVDPHQLAAEIRRQMGAEQALDAFKRANPDIASDRTLSEVADTHLARQIQGRRFEALEPAEAEAALAAAGQSTREWLRSVTPRDTSEPQGTGASSVIAHMKRARGQL